MCALHVIYCALVAAIHLISNLIRSISVNDCYTPDAPDDDPEITVNSYTRTPQQDEELGIDLLKTQDS